MTFPRHLNGNTKQRDASLMAYRLLKNFTPFAPGGGGGVGGSAPSAVCLRCQEAAANVGSRLADALMRPLRGLMQVKRFAFNCGNGAQRLVGADWRR